MIAETVNNPPLAPLSASQTSASEGPANRAVGDKATVDQGGLASKDTFLQLLVAQLSHQDPLNPADGLQFVSQLAEFTGLEQTMAIRADLDAIRQALESKGASTAASGPQIHS